MLDVTVRQAAERWGDATWMVGPSGWALTYSELDRLSDEVAVGLLERGITEGSVVAIALPSIPEYSVIYAAAAKVGAITAGVNHRLTSSERDAVIASAAPSIVIATDELAPARDDVVIITPTSETESALDAVRRAGAPGRLARDDDRPIAIVFTSGTTGLPKGAVFSGRQLDFICGVDTGHRWGGGAPGLSATSLAHLGPTTKMVGNLHRGGTIHLLDRWRAADALALTERFSMPAVAGIPTQVTLMMRHPDFETTDVSSVQAIIIGGGPATPSLVREARERFGAAVATRYACTEAGVGLGTGFADDPEDAEVSVGRPHPGVELSLCDVESGESVAAGAVGEVCLRSPAVMSRYWRDEAATAAAFTADGFVRTGDLGRLDSVGRLCLVGRAKEMFVRGGYNVYPMEVEAALADHPDVEQIAVVPRPDDVMGELGVAVVVPTPGAQPTLDALRASAAPRLARHKLPEDLVVVDALPLTPMEKLDRAALARLIGE